MEERSIAKVDELTPGSKQVDVQVKVLSLGDRKTIDSKYGGSKDLVEAVVGDETGTVIMTLWDDQIDRVAQDNVLDIENGYVSLVRGHMRLNVGKYGSFKESDGEIEEVNTSVDVSDREYESDRRGPRHGSGGRSSFGDRGFHGDGGPRRDNRRQSGRRRRY